jgi:G patch domain and KOW motifs-containing protein
MSECSIQESSKVSFALEAKKSKKRKFVIEDLVDTPYFDENDKPLIHPDKSSERLTPLIIPLLDSNRRSTLIQRAEQTSQESDIENQILSAVMEDQKNSETTSSTDFSILPLQNTNLNSKSDSKLKDKEKDQYIKQIHTLPDQVDEEAYNRVPVSQFGEALLRGMGWDGAESSNLPKLNNLRPHRLGLGATPRLILPDTIPGKIRTVEQHKKDDNLRRQQAEYDIERKKRIQMDKQLTLQVASLVYCRSRRAKIVKLDGVPGLNRVLVQFERDDAASSVQKGELTLIPRSDLENDPFHDHDSLESSSKNDPVKSSDIVVDLKNKTIDDSKVFQNDDRQQKKKLEKSKTKHRFDQSSSPGKYAISWLVPHIRVRVITRKLGSIHYKEKGVVLDVTSGGKEATLQMTKGQIVDRVPERYLETALPKSGGRVVILSKDFFLKKGTLLERDSDLGRGVVQLFEDMNVITKSLDDMAEWVGPLDDDLM